jgi:hypothetical protein
VALTAQSVAAFTLTEEFSADPMGAWAFGVGGTDPSTNRVVWDGTGSLGVHLDSSLPTVRFQRPLGATLTDTNNFRVSAQFRFDITSAPTNGYIQIAFGLVNSTLTGGNRTGTPGVWTDDDTFHTIEFNYFPNITDWMGAITGPTLTPAAFGARKPGSDAFGNFAAIFGSPSDLHDNTTGILALPEQIMLQADLVYDGAARAVTLNMYQVAGDGTLSSLNTELVPLNLPGFGYDTNFPFLVDSLAIMAYRDGFTTEADPSLVADVIFDRIEVTDAIPEPSSIALVVLGGLTAAVAVWRGRRT